MGSDSIAPDIVGGIGELVRAGHGWLVGGADAVDEYVAALDEIRRYPDEAARRVAGGAKVRAVAGALLAEFPEDGRGHPWLPRPEGRLMQTKPAPDVSIVRRNEGLTGESPKTAGRKLPKSAGAMRRC